MKFSACALALAAAVSAPVSTTVDASSIRGNTKASKKLMQKATRILEQNANNGNYNGQNGYYQQQQQGGGEGAEYSYLMGYSIKLLTCLNGQQTVNYETNEVDMSTVVFRLCPVDSCDNDSIQGCDEGYGDYTVGLSTFLEAYMEGQQEQQQNNNNNGNGQQYNYNYQDGGANQGNSMSMIYYSSYGDEFDVSEYARECREFNMEEFNNNNNNGNGQYYNGQYGNNGNGNAAYNLYMGPACASDGKGVRLAIFSDQYCSYENTDVSFNTLTNGMFSTIPYFVSETSSSSSASDGDDDGDDSSSTTTTEFVSLVPDTCMSCTDINDNNEYELSEVCTRTYEQSSARCEGNMEWKSYYGGYNDDKTCGLINDLLSGTGIVSYSKSSEGEGEDGSSSRKGLTWDLKDEYFWDVIVLILGVSAGILLVLYCVKDETVQKLKEAKENPSDAMASIKESTKSAAAGTKLLVTTAVATTVATVRRTFAAEETTVEKKISEDEIDYTNMEEPAPASATGEESKSAIISQEDTPKTHGVEEPKKKANSSRRMFGLMRGKSTK
mmetsp:Transcript_27231/g.65195  ORF Transcript_27231/g.65195 Transcript_27231/m.65195 type:complete len:553 (+) Transcript_27231:129-1787(+)